jgi:hypothetical protein
MKDQPVNYEQGLKFRYSTAAFDSYAKEGFERPEIMHLSLRKKEQLR